MAANLMENENGVHSYAGANKTAWHKLGVTVDGRMTSKEAIELAQLDYEVGITNLYANIGDEKQIISTHKATYNKRNKHIFGVVGQRYEVLQNLEAFDFLDGIVGEQKAVFDTAGALGMGETIFISVKLPKNIRVEGMPEEEIKNYLLFTTSHDGSGTVRVMFTPVRVVCANTLSAALQGKNMMNSWSIKHTKNARTKLNKVGDLFKVAYQTIDLMSYKFTEMSKFSMTDMQVNNVIAKTVLNPKDYIMEAGAVKLINDLSSKNNNLIYQLEKSIRSNVGQDNLQPNTAYAVFNGVTSYLQNTVDYKNENDKFKAIYQKSNLANKAMKELDIIMM